MIRGRAVDQAFYRKAAMLKRFPGYILYRIFKVTPLVDGIGSVSPVPMATVMAQEPGTKTGGAQVTVHGNGEPSLASAKVDVDPYFQC